MWSSSITLKYTLLNEVADTDVTYTISGCKKLFFSCSKAVQVRNTPTRCGQSQLMSGTCSTVACGAYDEYRY